MAYNDESKGYRLYISETKELIVFRDVIFDETKAWNWNKDKTQVQPIFEEFEGVRQEGQGLAVPLDAGSESPWSDQRFTVSGITNSPVRKIRPLQDIYESSNVTFIACEPHNFQDAGKEDVWKKAMDEEMNMIRKNGTWQLVDKPNDKEIIGLKWVYKTKLNEDGSLQKYKVRFVAKGFAQQPKIDFNETFSPVACMETIRTVLALVAQLGLLVFQQDVKSAFLNGELEEEVYVEQPQGYVIRGQEDKVFRVKKALYGLKQAPRAWNI
ncbi:hypothetical protein RJ640_000711 [Escallonia rubra]|uniref:Reverse transcriptase n=1 Tax=Escallonia rubra TaxID=112253 RepID=A0AA88UQ89_9ASTE|nr:hypothetical protein RJ640_000711 [Escallonia rubra]